MMVRALDQGDAHFPVMRPITGKMNFLRTASTALIMLVQDVMPIP
jgi:hypothetical protein